MKTEATKGYRHGFLLTEQELRRLLDTVSQQIMRVNGGSEPVTNFELKFRNGAISETNSIEEVLSLENLGSRGIVRCALNVKDRNDDTHYSVLVEFKDADHETDDLTSVSYKLFGEERDWVFITSSEVEERIGRIKIFAPNQLGKRFLFNITMIIMFLLTFVPMFFLAMRGNKPSMEAVKEVESEWRSGKLIDPVEATIKLQKAELKRTEPDFLMFIPTMGVPVAAILLVIMAYFYKSINPFFNFYWGDYIRVYDRKRALRKYLLIVVISGILVSIISAAFAKKLGL